MFTDERRQIILSALSVHGTASVGDLSRMVRSSEVTVRRDLKALAEAGMVVRHRGGASVGHAHMDEPSFLEKSVVAADEKLGMAAAAAELIEDGDVVVLGPGTTTQALAQRLTHRRLMVATTSVLVAMALADAPEAEVLLIGGILRGNIRAVIGGEAERAMSRLHFDKAFLSGNGLTAANGLSTPNLHVASVDRAAVESAAAVVVLADHTKIGVDSMVQTLPTSRIDALVTDSGADAAELTLFEEAGVEVRVADPARLLGTGNPRRSGG